MDEGTLVENARAIDPNNRQGQRAAIQPRLRRTELLGKLTAIALTGAAALVTYQIPMAKIPLFKPIADDPTTSSLRRSLFNEAHDHYQASWIWTVLAICAAAATYFVWTHHVYLSEREFRDAPWTPKDMAIRLALPPVSLFACASVVGHATSRPTHATSPGRVGGGDAASWLLLASAALIGSVVELRWLGTANAHSAKTGMVVLGIGVSILQIAALGMSVKLIRSTTSAQRGLLTATEDSPAQSGESDSQPADCPSR